MEEGSAEELLFKDQDFSSELLRQLNALRQSGMLTDVTLCSGGFEVPCHRNVLASSSPYFKAMFCNNFKESHQAKVILKGIDAEILDQIILYVYTGEILISAENVLCLLETASMLQYAKLFEACSAYLQDKLTPDNCLSMVRLSKILNCQSLNKKAKAMALKCFPEVASSEDLKDLCPLELLDYLGDDDLCGEEEQVFETLMVWIRHDLQARQGYIQELFKKVRLQYVHPTFLFHFIANDSLVQSSPTCRSILESAWRQMFSLYSTNAPDIKPMVHVPRRYSNQEFLIIIGGRKDNKQTTRDVLLYDDKTNQWLSLAKLPVRLYKPSAVSLHSNIYVLGGMPVSNKKSPVSDNIYIYSLKLNQWRLVEPMLVPRYSHRSLAYKNYILSFGGIGENQEILNSVERYDSIYNTCESMANMPVAVLHPAVAAKDQRVYLFGGEDIMQNPVRLIQVYHVSRNTWFRMETRVVKNVCAPAAAIGDQIIMTRCPHAPVAMVGLKPPEVPPPAAVKFLSAGTAACIADVCTFPLDTAKVRLQIQGEVRIPRSPSTVEYRGVLGTLSTMVRTEGPRSLYSGLAAGLQRQMSFASIRIGLYDSVKQLYTPKGAESTGLGARLLAGCTTGAVAVTCAQPTDVVKVRFQAHGALPDSARRYSGTVDAYRTIAREEGVRGLWRGTLPNIARNAIVNCGELVTYDLIKDALLRAQLLTDNVPCHFVAAFGAGFCATVVASPVDVVKTRYMNAGPGQYRNVPSCLLALLMQDGLAGLYKGFVPSFLRLGSWNVVMFISYEQLQRAAVLAWPAPS